MNITINRSPYRTSDFALASALSIWYPVISLKKVSGSNKVEFEFEYDNEMHELVEQYWRGELSVDPQRYFQQLKVLKTRIHSGQ